MEFKEWLIEYQEYKQSDNNYPQYTLALFYLCHEYQTRFSSNETEYNNKLIGKDLILYRCLKQIGCEMDRITRVTWDEDPESIYDCARNSEIYPDGHDYTIAGLGYVGCWELYDDLVVVDRGTKKCDGYNGSIEIFNAMLVNLPSEIPWQLSSF